MNTTLPPKDKFVAAMAAIDAKETLRGVGRKLVVPEATLRNWVLNRARFTVQLNAGVAIAGAAPAEPTLDPGSKAHFIREIAGLKQKLSAAMKEDITAEYIKKSIFGLKEDAEKIEAPKWLIEPHKATSSPGVPTLFMSDLHWGERVFPSQIGGVNEYNLEIAQRRARNLIERTIDLLFSHMVNPNYPGLVLALGGDMVSGGIHEELLATDEKEIMPIVLDLVAVLIWCITMLVERFGKLFIPCVSGNHGRSTHKIRAKGRNFTSFDWLIYHILELHFRGDKRITFHIPDGSDALYRIYEHRYLLTHGDQFRGGDGVIGALGPIIRGDHRKRSRNGQIGMGYDTMMIGHFHQYIQLQRLIVNGSLKGYDEYAYTSNFPYERARQALWLTHPKRGITFSLPVNVDDQPGTSAAAEWVSVQKAA